MLSKYNQLIRVHSRFYSLKFKASIVNYKQMPDVFYNYKHKQLPPSMFTGKFGKDIYWSMTEKMAEVMMKIQYEYDISVPAFIQRIIKYRYNKIKEVQMIPSEAIDDLGVDLSVAHLIVQMGGSIKLCNVPEWIGPINIKHKKEIFTLLPCERVQDFYIESINLSGCLITYEGLEYISNLTKMKELIIRSAPFLDDHCLRRISKMRKTLEYLDISNCPQISSRGLSTLWNLKNLKTLVLENHPLLEDKELVCLLLLEKLTELDIVGIDYIAGLRPEQKDRILQLVSESDKMEKTPLDTQDELLRNISK